MNMKKADQLGAELTPLIQSGRQEESYALLAPTLAERTPFRYLERIGETFGGGHIQPVRVFLDLIAGEGTEGGWVVIGGALRAQLDRDLAGAFDCARKYIIAADVWYGADIIAERVPGPGLVYHFDDVLPLLRPWKEDPSHWVRRALGVGIHFWAKRSKGKSNLNNKVIILLDFLEPMFTEWDMDVAKGIGFGLKTLGKYYPDLLADWLPGQIQRRYRAVMLKKALTYLPKELRTQIMNEGKRLE
jgi:hypothetical protein